MNFITTQNGEFRDGSTRFRFIGANTYLLFKSSLTAAQLDTHFTYAKADGINVIRTWAYGNDGNSNGNLRYRSGSTLNWREASFFDLDKVIWKAGVAGMRLILSLTDEFSFDDKNNYCIWSNAIHATSYTADGSNRCWEFMTNANIKA